MRTEMSTMERGDFTQKTAQSAFNALVGPRLETCFWEVIRSSERRVKQDQSG